MTVYAGIFLSGNRTASVGGIEAASLGRAPVYSLDNRPRADERPKAGAIVRQSDGLWRDFAGEDWSAVVPFELPDYDVFVLDASGSRPVVSERISGVGTVLFDIAVRPGRWRGLGLQHRGGQRGTARAAPQGTLRREPHHACCIRTETAGRCCRRT